MRRIAIIFLGPPGAGKGTQARMLGESLKYPRISTGDMLREAIRRNTAMGRKAQRFMEAGDLVPDGLVDAIVKDRLSRKDCGSGFILDGYPRTLRQVEYLDTLFENGPIKIVALGIKVRNEVLTERLAARWTCSNCGKIFNAESTPGIEKKRCDECKGPLVHRKDDSAQVVEERLKVYHEATEPLIDYYRKRGCYREIDGEQTVQDIHGTLKRIIKALKQPEHAVIR